MKVNQNKTGRIGIFDLSFILPSYDSSSALTNIKGIVIITIYDIATALYLPQSLQS